MNRYLSVVGLLVCGCATNLSSLQTARTLPQGHVRVTGGLGYYVPAGQVVNTLSTGVALGKKAGDALAKNEEFVFTEEEEQSLLTAGLALAILPPSPLAEINVRVGVVDNFDMGLRLATNSIRADAKYRLLHTGADDLHPASEAKGIDAWFSRIPGGQSGDIAIGVGASYYFLKNPVTDLLGYIKMDDFTRFDLDGTVYLSYDAGTYFSVYGAPKYIFSRTSLDATLVRLSHEAGMVVRTDIGLPTQVDTHFVGATAGIRIGHPVISVYLELTLGNTFASAKILGATRELGGFTAYPSAGLALAF